MVKAAYGPVKDFDPGRERMYAVYRSDTPLPGFEEILSKLEMGCLASVLTLTCAIKVSPRAE